MADSSPIWPILEALKDDDELYVRRSVANNLNDIAKDHPDRVVSICLDWQKNKSAETDWIIKHGTRTLVKQGNPKVFQLLGFTPDPKVEFKNLTLSPKVKLGDSLDFSFDLKSESSKDQKIVIDFAIHHMKANGKLAPKVFKLKNLDISTGETINISKSHPIKKITTRKYYPGLHKLEILINGQSKAIVDFELEV